jgi:hypothetical protein
MIVAAHDAVTALHDGPSLLESSRVREKSLCLDQSQGINMPLEQGGIPLDLDQVSCEKAPSMNFMITRGKHPRYVPVEHKYIYIA